MERQAAANDGIFVFKKIILIAVGKIELKARSLVDRHVGSCCSSPQGKVLRV